jgi:hypothetical protein
MKGVVPKSSHAQRGVLVESILGLIHFDMSSSSLQWDSFRCPAYLRAWRWHQEQYWEQSDDSWTARVKTSCSGSMVTRRRRSNVSPRVAVPWFKINDDGLGWLQATGHRREGRLHCSSGRRKGVATGQRLVDFAGCGGVDGWFGTEQRG